MSHSPALIKKASRLIVIACEPGAFHTYDPATSNTHTLKISAFGGYVCDCEAGARGQACTHRIAVHWHRQEQHDKHAAVSTAKGA